MILVETAVEPPLREAERLGGVFARGVARGAFVEGHHNVGSDRALGVDDAFGREEEMCIRDRHRVGEVPQVHPRVRRRVARLQPLPVERSLYVGRQGQTARTGRGEDVLDGLLLAGLRLHRSRHASQGHRLEGEPQRPAVVPRGADIQYRRDVRDRLPALRPAKAGALRTRFQGRW